MMPVVYCNADGKPLVVSGLDNATSVGPPKDTAFTVGVTMALAKAIQQNPGDYQFDGRTMGNVRAWGGRRDDFARTSQAFAKKTAARRRNV